MAALLFKVGALALKTLAKPLGSRFEQWAMTHPVARRMIIDAAQKMHRVEVYITRGAEGKGGRVFVGAMSEEKSLEMASKLASEGFVFTVGIGIVMVEYERQRRKDLEKRRKEEQERMQILDQARQERERLADENREQQDLIHDLLSRVERLEKLRQQEEQKPKGMFGGFFGPRALSAASG